MSKIITALSVYDVPLIGGALKAIVNGFWKGIYGIYFAIVKAIAWVLDMLTQLFFIFAGMTPVSSTSASEATGEYAKIDIVNFFLTQSSFQKAYLYLCLVALGLIIVFAIGKIVKQDYFDRNGPRSKGPIFRNIALSFIAFICIIPVFYFLIDIVAALALLVMQAMGYKGGGIGSLVFNISWEDNGDTIKTVGRMIGTTTGYQPIGDSGFTVFFSADMNESSIYDADNFGWYSGDTFYAYYWDSYAVKSNPNTVEFYWYIFIFTGLILIVNLGQMMLAMVTRMYNLIALFIVAPSPISQIVLDDGAKFKGWKDKVLQEALKVVGCVMSFMLFIMIISVVNTLDLMKYAYTEEAASSLSLLEDNNLTTQLSNVSALYYGGDQASWVDKAINALGRCMIILAGVGAIKDIDQTITPFISGGSSSMDMGNAGKSLVDAGSAAVNGAMAIGRAGVGLAVKGATAAVSLAAGAGGEAAQGIEAGIGAGKSIAGGASEAINAANTSAPSPSGPGGGGGGAAPDLGSPSDASGSAPESDAAGDASPGSAPNNQAPEAEAPEAEAAGGDAEGDDAAADTTAEVGAPEAEAAGEETEGDDAAADTTAEAGAPEAEAASGDAEGDDAAADTTAEAGAPEAEAAGGDAEGDDAAADTTAEAGAPEAEAASGDAEGAASPTETSTPTDGSSETQTGGTTSSTSADTGTNDGKKAFATMHSSGKLGKGAKFARKALAVGGGITSGATKAALGITKQTLKTGGGLALTGAKTGFKVAGILAKTVMQMTGMGKLAGIVDENIKAFKKDDLPEIKKAGAKMVKNVRQQAPKYANAAKGAANVAKKVGNKIGETKVGQAFSKAGNYVSSAGGIGGVGFKGAADIIDAISRSRNTMSKEDKENLDAVVDNGNAGVTSNAATVTNTATSADEVSSSAQQMVASTNEQLTDASALNEASSAITGETNKELVVDNDTVAQVRDLDRSEETYGKVAVAHGGDADRAKAIEEHMATVDSKKSQWQVRDMTRQDLRRTNFKRGERASYLHSIHCASAQLADKHADVIKKYNDGDRSAETLQGYSSYLQQARELDDAFLFAHSGGGSEATFDKLSGGLREVKDSQGRAAFRKDSFKEDEDLSAIQARAKAMAGLGSVGQEMKTKKKDLEENASAATRQAISADRLDEATKAYDKVRTRPGASADQVESARAHLASSAAELSDRSTIVRGHAAATRDQVVKTSKRNASLNKGNAKFDRARDTVKANIESMKTHGASEEDIAAAEERYEGLNNMATSDGAPNAYQNAKRRKVKVTATKEMEKLGGSTKKSAVKAAKKNGMDYTEPTQTSGGATEVISGTDYEVGVVVDMTDKTATSTAISKGVGSAQLEKIADAYRASGEGKSDADNKAFIKSVLDYSDSDFINEEVEQVIKGIKKESIPDTHKGFTAAEYRKDVKARYENAVNSYNAQMERARGLAEEYTSSGDPTKLVAVRDAIARAVRDSETIRTVKTELKIDE